MAEIILSNAEHDAMYILHIPLRDILSNRELEKEERKKINKKNINAIFGLSTRSSTSQLDA